MALGRVVERTAGWRWGNEVQGERLVRIQLIPDRFRGRKMGEEGLEMALSFAKITVRFFFQMRETADCIQTPRD